MGPFGGNETFVLKDRIFFAGEREVDRGEEDFDGDAHYAADQVACSESTSISTMERKRRMDDWVCCNAAAGRV